MTRYTDDFMWYELGIKELPKFLYHYTTFGSLEKILTNKTIQFSRLDIVNDPDEASNDSIKQSKKLLYASCWTETENSIPMWNMYANNFEGVVIKAPINFFEGRNKPVIWEKGGATTLIKSFINIGMHTTKRINGPNKICYNDDYSAKLLNNHGNGIFEISSYDIGLFKKNIWNYENEWRFLISNIPSTIGDSVHIDEHINFMNEYIAEDIERLYIKIDDDAFNEFEIITGKKISSENRKQLEQILLDNNLDIPIFESSIRINL